MDLDRIEKEGLSEEVIKNFRADWSLAHDVKLLKFLENFSKNLISRANETLTGLDEFEKDLSSLSLNIQTVSQNFQSLSNKQFIEHCVLEEDVSVYSKPSKSTSEVSVSGSNDNLNKALSSCLATFNEKYYNQEESYLNNRFHHFSSAESFSKKLPPLIGSDKFSQYYSELFNSKKETKVEIPKQQAQEEIHDNNSEFQSSQHSSSSNVDLDEDNYSFRGNLVTSANFPTCPSDNNSMSSDSDINDKVTNNSLNQNQSSQWRPNDNFGINKGYSFAPPPPNQSLFDDDDEDDDLFASCRSDLFIDNKSDLFDSNSNLPIEVDQNNGFVNIKDAYKSEDKSLSTNGNKSEEKIAPISTKVNKKEENITPISTKVNKNEEKNTSISTNVNKNEEKNTSISTNLNKNEEKITPISTKVNKSDERFIPPLSSSVKPQIDQKLNPKPFLFNDTKTEQSLFSGDSSDDDLWKSSTDLNNKSKIKKALNPIISSPEDDSLFQKKKVKNEISEVKNTRSLFESDDNKLFHEVEKPKSNLSENQENKCASALFNKEPDSVPDKRIPSKSTEKTFNLFSEDSSDEEPLWNAGNSNAKNNFKKLLEQKLFAPKSPSSARKISSDSQDDESPTNDLPSSPIENVNVESTKKVKSILPDQERVEPVMKSQEDKSFLPSYHTSTLQSLSKNRAKIRNKRRPPTRKHLKHLTVCSTDDTFSSKDDSSFENPSNPVSILSPSTEEEDLFVVPPNPIGHDNSNSNLFAASSLLSPGSSLDNQSLFADAISEIDVQSDTQSKIIDGDKSLKNDSTIKNTKRTGSEEPKNDFIDKTAQSPNLKINNKEKFIDWSLDKPTSSKKQDLFSEDIFEKDLSSDLNFTSASSKLSLGNSVSQISSEKVDSTSSHNISDIFSKEINNDSLKNQLSSNSIRHSPPPLFPSKDDNESSKKEDKFFWNTNTSLFNESSDDDDDLFGSKSVKKSDNSSKNAVNTSQSSLRSKFFNKDAAQDLFSSDDESLFKTNDKNTKQKSNKTEPANKPDNQSAATSGFKDPLSIFNDDAA